ncbi:MAG: multidrug transporter [Verrucomicrobiae bacterium]|nr:multidrug transporter [Verrucomicrobiae bacterium]
MSVRWWMSVGVGASLAIGTLPVGWAQESEAAAGREVRSTTATTPLRSGDGSDPVEVAADALVVRPLGLAATAVGAAIWVVALPFSAISGDVDRTGQVLVGGPARFTFRRRLGDFEPGRW